MTLANANSLTSVMHALKEWAILVKAVEEGKQFILFRKGGILDDGFSVESNEFLLYPTFEHQSREYIKDEYKKDFDTLVNSKRDDNTVTIRSIARVYGYYESSDRSKLLGLSKFHILNDEFIDYRMQWNRSKPVSIMLVRAYMLDEPLVLPIKQEYYGCRSWIRIMLDDGIITKSLKGSKPIVDDATIASIKKEVESILEV
jgi:hypothetical protein